MSPGRLTHAQRVTSESFGYVVERLDIRIP